MIINRKPKEYYVVSSLSDLDGSMLEPRHQISPVPFLEDTTKRIPIYSSVRGAIAAKGAKDGEILSVYRVTGIYSSNIIRPGVTQSPIAEPLNEYWALSRIQLRKIGDVKVEKVIEKKEIPLGKLQRKHTIEFRRWTDLRPEWQQKKERLYSLSHTIEAVPFSQEIIDEFKGPGNMLKHCRWTSEMDGFALMKGGSDLAGYVVWSAKDKEIKGLEVMKDYRRQGLGEELLDLANENGIRTLTVNRKNKPALDLYRKCGYKPVRESGAMIWMKKE